MRRLLAPAFAVVCAATASADLPATDPVRALLLRRAPKVSPFIELELAPSGDSTTNGGHFELLNSTLSPLNITIRGSDTNALAAGLHWYFRYVGGRHISWYADNLASIPLPPPRPQSPIRQKSAAIWRYAWNVCTHGYTMAWWDWSRWELELDFMALSGVNLPLLFTGEEYIWTRVFTKLNMTDAELGAFFSGPAFRPWQWMGNEAGWGGPLSPAYQQQSHELQLKILKRAIELGMVPVLPCFAGNVPAGFDRLFPNAKTKPYPPWNGFPQESLLLDPTDPMFLEIGRMFVAEQKSVYSAAGVWGSSTGQFIFNCDVWINDRHNFQPACDGSGLPACSTYLPAAGKAMADQLTTIEPNAIWLPQGGWMWHYPWWQQKKGKRVELYLQELPANRILILELAADRWVTAYELEDERNYWGRPWIWSMFHNGGGRPGMYGDLDMIATQPTQAILADNSTCIGIGISAEGIENNPVMYEVAWRAAASGPSKESAPVIDVPAWVRKYAARRYGYAGTGSSPDAETAWHLLYQAAYQKNEYPAPRFAIAGPQALVTSANQKTGERCAQAWSLLAKAAIDPQQLGLTASSNSSAILYDLIDVGRQILSEAFDQLLLLYSLEYRGSQHIGRTQAVAALDAIGKAMLGLLTDLDELLGTGTTDAWLLGRWISTARISSTSSAEADLFEMNARNQLMMWGPNLTVGPNPTYAQKHWQGLVGDYYRPIWALFLETATATAANGSALPTEALASQLEAEAQVFSAETIRQQQFATTPTGGGQTLNKTLLLQAEYSSADGRLARDWIKIPHADHGSRNATLNLEHNFTGGVGRLAWLCSVHPRCVAFNSDGWLKSNATVTRSGPGVPADLYVRRSAGSSA